MSLDDVMPIETFEEIEKQYIKATHVLINKYQLPVKGFIDELTKRIQKEEILEEPDVVHWQGLYEAYQTWIKEK